MTHNGKQRFSHKTCQPGMAGGLFFLPLFLRGCSLGCKQGQRVCVGGKDSLLEGNIRHGVGSTRATGAPLFGGAQSSLAMERIVRSLLLVCAFCLADFEGNKRLLASPWRVAAARIKRSSNACLPNPCQHRAPCQLMENGPICSCRPGFTGTFCQDVIMKLTCEEGRMKMMVRKEAFDLLKIPKQLVHLRNQACKVSETEERGELFFAATLTGENHTACGSVIQQNGSHVSYSNVMESGWDTHGAAIPESFQLELNFSCDYAYERVVRLPTGRTTADRPAQFEVREGHFNVSMRLYKTASYLQPYHLPTEAVPIEDTLYVLLEIEGQHQLNFLLSVEGCWGTASTDPYQEAQHKLIEEGCPYDETVIYLNSFGESATAKFRFQMFQIVSYTKVFLHCRVQLCLPSGPEPCAKQCPRHWRSKQALANDYTKIASYGPIYVLEERTNHSRNDQKDWKGHNRWLPTTLLVLCTLTLLLVIVAAISARRWLA